MSLDSMFNLPKGSEVDMAAAVWVVALNSVDGVWKRLLVLRRVCCVDLVKLVRATVVLRDCIEWNDGRNLPIKRCLRREC